MTLKQTLDEFIKSRVMAGLAPKTIVDYREFCGRFVDRMGRDREYCGLNQDDIEKYILELMGLPLSKSTVATYIRHCKVYLKWCSDNYTDTGYNYKRIRVPKSPKKNVLIYGDEEIMMMFQMVDVESDWMVARNCATLALMLDSGFRQAEITRALHKDFDFKRHTVNVHGKGEKDRVVPLGRVSEAYIRQYMSLCPCNIGLKDNLFVNRDSTPLTENTVKLMVYKLSHKLPFELSSHKLRHNFATNYCLNQYREYGQIDIYQLMYLMGHEDVKTTSRYLHFAYEIIATEKSISHIDRVFRA